MRVEIVTVQRGRETVTAVRSVGTRAVLWACVAIGARGAALGAIEATAYCGRKGHAIVPRALEAGGERAA